MYDLITIIGPTASGKTALAAALAAKIGGEVISGDSRQVYRGMTIGTGKDLADYNVGGKAVPYHLIDIVEAGYKYSVYEFQRDFRAALADVKRRGNVAVLCGGSGLYIEAALKGYSMVEVPPNQALRESLQEKSLSELREILADLQPLHNTTDTETHKRAVRAIEIAHFYKTHPQANADKPLNALVVGVEIARETRRQRISARLKARLKEGLVAEVEELLKTVSPSDLMYYGLEYKFVTQFVLGEITENQLFTNLEIAIHQFAKRQMTWFRGMERRGVKIHWQDFSRPIPQRVEEIESLFNAEN